MEELIALTKLVPMASIDSGGGATAERMYRTAWLWDCNSGSSLSSDMRKISGLIKTNGLLMEAEPCKQTDTYRRGSTYGNIKGAWGL